MKLVKEEVLFIDTYLKNNGVIYADIRQEMTDHIASAVEEKMAKETTGFYDAFKDFMATNKKEILKNNKRNWGFSGIVIKQFLLFLLKPYMLVFGVLLFLFFRNTAITTCFTEDFRFRDFIFCLIMALSIFQLVYFRLIMKKRFYIIEKTGSILLILYYMHLFFLPISRKATVSVYTITFFSFLLLGYITFFIQNLMKFKRHQYLS